MGARFTFDPTKVSAGNEIFPKDTYSFEIGDAASWESDNTASGGKLSFGIGFPLKIISENAKGKRTYFSCLLSADAAMPFAKMFMMAAKGFTIKQENEFNQTHGTDDFTADYAAKTVGAFWSSLKGQCVTADLDVTVRKDNGSDQQQFSNWRPYSG